MPGSALLQQAWYEEVGWSRLLRPLEWFYRTVISLRRSCYSHGMLASYRAGRPVVIVGNIHLGGTGKTPVVIALVESLHRQGIRAGVVCRGYGGEGGRIPHIVSADSDPSICGDEALFVHLRTNCPCVAAPSRVAAVQTLLRVFDVDVVISDDGLQHYALERDMEIVLYDAVSGFGNGRCLPVGPLRESVNRLDTVDFVLAKHGADRSTRVCYRLEGLVNVNSGQVRDASPLGLGVDVYAVAGIAQPNQFFDALRDCGFVPQMRVFPDHHRYRARDFSELTDKPILMTEKDAVKCRALVGQNAWYLKISAELPGSVIGAVVSLVRR